MNYSSTKFYSKGSVIVVDGYQYTSLFACKGKHPNIFPDFWRKSKKPLYDIPVEPIKVPVVKEEPKEVKSKHTYTIEALPGKDGKDGKEGPPGKDGKDGLDGKDGKNGKDGRDGSHGIDGLDGADGFDGRDGKDGAPGKDGKDGRDGKDGLDGLDGESLEFKWEGTQLGIKKTSDEEYTFKELGSGSSFSDSLVSSGTSRFILTSNGTGSSLISASKPRAASLKSIVAGTGVTIDTTDNDITINASGSSSATVFTEIEKNIGSLPRLSGSFTITGLSGLTIGKPINIFQASGPYTDKGTRADEAEMDGITVTAKVTATDTITAYWNSATRVKGNIKFNYLIGE